MGSNKFKIKKQPTVPENQTAWNSDNKGIKENINQHHQSGKAVDHAGQLRKTEATRWTLGAGLAAELGRLHRTGLT